MDTPEKTKQKFELIYKFSFTNPLFLEHDIILNWDLSNIVLITCFDLLKDQRLMVDLQRSGQTLKGYLHEKGFNKKVKIFCDTGIFEYEAKKAKLHLNIPEENATQSFTNDDIFHAYSLIDPDYLVAPDSIILQEDSVKEAQTKILKMEEYLRNTLEVFPKDKVVPVLQGFNSETILPFIDSLKDEQIRKIARGGLIPLWNESKGKFKEVIKISESLTRENGITYIHSFGLPSLRAIKDYFYDNTYNSLDTSVIYYRTAQRKFLINRGYFISVRYAHFDRCNCEGCQIMQRNIYRTNSSNFIIGLYFHNCFRLNKLIMRLPQEPLIFEDPKGIKKKFRSGKGLTVSSENILADKCFITAIDLLNQPLLTKNIIFIKKSPCQTLKIPLKILVISSCSKNKSLQGLNVLSRHDLRTEEQRNKILQLCDNKVEAKDLYDSKRVQFLLNVTHELKLVSKTELYFLSAGFGLVHESKQLPLYDVSFSNKSQKEVEILSKELKIQESIDSLAEDYDLIFLDLSPQYLKALQPLTNLIAKSKEIIQFNMQMIIQDKVVTLNEQRLLEIDKQTNKFAVSLDQYTRISLLKNFFLFLINQDILGPFISFKNWIIDNITINNSNMILRSY